MVTVKTLRPVATDEQASHHALVTSPEVAAAHAKLQAAEEEKEKRSGAVRVAEAKLADAQRAAPPVSARLRETEQRRAAARTAAEVAAERMHDAARAMADREDDVTAAQAQLADRTDGVKPSTDGELVTAQMKLAKAERAQQAAHDLWIARREAHELAERELAAAEQEHDDALAAPPVMPAAVVAAEVALTNAKNAEQRASRALDAARTEHNQASQQAAEQADNNLPRFGSLEDFVTLYLLPNWRHKQSLKETHWCAWWWRHGEAMARLEHLWEAFEVARTQQAPAMSMWWLEQADRHMAALTGPGGAFNRCIDEQDNVVHTQPRQWDSMPAPEGQFSRSIAQVDPAKPSAPTAHPDEHSEGASA